MFREKSYWKLWTQFLDLVFIFFDMFDTFTSLKSTIASCFCSIGLMLYDFVSIATVDQLSSARLESGGKRVQQLEKIVMKWNFKSFSETLLMLSGDRVVSTKKNDDNHSELQEHIILAKTWILDRSNVEGEASHQMKESWQKKALIRLEAISLRNNNILVHFLPDLLDIAGGSATETQGLARALLQRLYLQQECSRHVILNKISTLLDDCTYADTMSLRTLSENLLLRCARSEGEIFQNIIKKVMKLKSLSNNRSRKSSGCVNDDDKTIQTFLSLI